MTDLRTSWRPACAALMAASLLSLVLFDPAPSLASTQCKQLFDGTLYQHKPNLREYGFQHAIVVEPLRWWGPKESKNTMTKERGLESWVLQAIPGDILVLDNEVWQTTGDSTTVANSVRMFGETVDRIRAAGLSKQIGYYGVPPNRDYWRAIKGPGSKEYAAWQAENDLLSTMVDKVDALFPSLYTFYDDPLRWKAYAIANLKEARRIGKGKPVYAFLWPQYHDSNNQLSGKYIPTEFWAMELDIALNYSDGIVIWGGWRQDWDDHADWWTTAKSMVNKYSVCPPPSIPKSPQLILTK